MAKLNSGKISGRTVDALPVGDRETVFWDRDMAGFGVRVYPTGAKVYLAQARVGGRPDVSRLAGTGWCRPRTRGWRQRS